MRRATLIVAATIPAHTAAYSKQDPAKPLFPKAAAPALKVELEKLQSADMNLRLEGAFKIDGKNEAKRPGG